MFSLFSRKEDLAIISRSQRETVRHELLFDGSFAEACVRERADAKNILESIKASEKAAKRVADAIRMDIG